MFFQRSARVINYEQGHIYAMEFPGRYETDDSVVHKDFESEFADLAINQRAWCFQERSLAKAVLHLGPRFVGWDCCTSRIFHDSCQKPTEVLLQEFGLMIAAITYDERNVQALSTEALWNMVVSEYSKRRLFEPTDKLAAIAGLAEVFEKKGWSTGRYLAGLWEGSLYIDLMWRCVPQSTLTRKAHLMLGDGQKIPDGQIATEFPSWTWASVTGEINYQSCLSGTTYPTEDGCVIDFANISIHSLYHSARSQAGSIRMEARIQSLESLGELLTKKEILDWLKVSP